MLPTRCLLPLLALFLGVSAHASITERTSDPTLLLDRWTIEDGLPLNHVVDLAIAPDGLLWLATFNGLVRFDGQQMRVFQRTNLDGLPSNRLTAIEITPDGTIWVLTELGDLVRILPTGVKVWRVHEDLPGPARTLQRVGDAIWMHTEGGPMRLTHDGPDKVFPGLQGDASTLLIGENDVATWFGMEMGDIIAVYADGQTQRWGSEHGLPPGEVHDALIDEHGTVWVASAAGLLRSVDDSFEMVIPAARNLTGEFCQLFFEDGTMMVRHQYGWLERQGDAFHTVSRETLQPQMCHLKPMLGSAGLWRQNGTAVDVGDKHIELGHVARAFVEDSEGDVWIATDGAGLVRLRPASVTPFLPEGSDVRDVNVRAVFHDEEGTWLATQTGGIVHVHDKGQTWIDSRSEEVQGIQGMISLSIFKGPDGARYAGTATGPCLLTTTTCIRQGLPPGFAGLQGIRSSVVGPDGTWWVGHSDGLEQGIPLGDGTYRWRRSMHPDDVPVHPAISLTLDPDGHVLAATNGHGLLQWRDNQWARVDESHGLASNQIRSLWVEHEHLWVGTEDHGICRLTPIIEQDWAIERMRVACIDRRHGLVDDTVHAMLPDKHGRIWTSTNAGISWLDRSQLMRALDGQDVSVTPVTLTERHGMAHREGNGASQPCASVDPQGRMWFATQRGAAIIDPATVEIPSAPRVAITRLEVEGGRIRVPDEEVVLRLNSSQRDISANWTASALHWPRQVRYRHRLVGWDNTWSAPSLQHDAAWTNLPPGPYTLELQTGIGGHWRRPKRVSFHRPPAFHETAWFPLSFAAIALLIAVLVARARGISLERRRQQLQMLVQTRTRALARANQDLSLRGDLLTSQARELTQRHGEIERQNQQIRAQADRLSQVDELKTRFVASLSHEIRTPLTLIAGPLHALETEFAQLGPEAQQHVTVARTNVARLEHLVGQLLDISRIEAGGVPLRVRQVDLRKLIERVAVRFSSDARSRKLHLSLALPTEPVVVFADPDLLDKVITNLLANAFKFTPPGGRVTVTLEPASDHDEATLHVQDTGIGIAPEEQPRVFDRFYQVDHGDDRTYEGAGIGLSLSRELVELHGGSLSIESEPGEGTTFTVCLPTGSAHLAVDEIDLSAASPAAQVPAVRATQDPSWPRVLVVEDHPDMRGFLVDQLSKVFQIDVAANGAEALSVLRERRPDAVVSDVMMPVMDGITMAQQLRSDPDLWAIPVVLVSAKAAPDDIARGEAVAYAYLTKPFRMPEVIEAVRKALAAQRPAEPAPSEEATARRDVLAATVAAHMHTPQFNAEGLATALGVDLTALQADTLRVADCTPTQFIRMVRMERAHQLLQDGTHATVQGVADAVGLRQSYFTRLYTAWFGHPPSTEHHE